MCYSFSGEREPHELTLYFKKAKIVNATLPTLRKSFCSLLIQEKLADIYKVSIDGMKYILKSF